MSDQIDVLGAPVPRRAELAVRHALRDLWYDRSGFLCQCLILTGLIAPFLILIGLKQGVVSEMSASVLEDPENLAIEIAHTASYTPALLERLRRDPKVAFAMPTPRSISLDFEMFNPDDPATGYAEPGVLASGPGDPYLPSAGDAPAPGAIILSGALAARLGVKPGGRVSLLFDRVWAGDVEEIAPVYQVAAVLDPKRWSAQGALMHVDDLFAIQNWSDGERVDAFGPTGRAPSGPRRVYPQFRIYAVDIAAGFALIDELSREGLAVQSLLPSATRLHRLSKALDWALGLASLVGVAGAAGGLSAGLWSNVARKRRSLSLMLLSGFRRWHLALFPVAQSLAVALCGAAVSLIVFYAAAAAADPFVRSELGLLGEPFILSAAEIAALFATSSAVALAASLIALAVVLKIDPVEGVVE